MKNSKLINGIPNKSKMKSKRAAAIVMAVMACSSFVLTGCGNETSQPQADSTGEEVELVILAAASLTDACNEIKEKYEAENGNVTLTFSYGGSGALQTQIEEGAPADIFISAAMTQMNVLDEEGLMDTDTIVELLENKVVLIVPKESELNLTDFSGVAGDEIAMIGLGDPASVPVGQYAEEIFTFLGILDIVKGKANYGTDVRNVLSWVENGEVDCGVVYSTDAGTTENVTIVAVAPDDSCKPVIYPVGVVESSQHKDAANEFIEYLQSEETMALFEDYGFLAAE